MLARFCCRALLLTLLACSRGEATGQPVQPTSRPVPGIWLSAEEVMRLPTTGPAWNQIKKIAYRNFGKARGGHTDNHDVFTYAQALVAVRLNDADLRKRVAENILSAMGSENNGNVLSISRNLLCYVLAADLIDLKNVDPEGEARFRKWLVEVRRRRFGKQGSIVSVQEKRPNNFGTHATASRAAVARYLGEEAELQRTAQVFKGWLGDRQAYAGFKFGELSWQANPKEPVGINPKGATKAGVNIDGVLPDDQRRGGPFTWPPPKVNYVYGALQGALAAANILHRAGYDTWNWQDQALLRAYRWLYEVADFPAQGDDRWQLPLIDAVYGTKFWDGAPVGHGKNMGWTDWTHGGQARSRQP